MGLTVRVAEVDRSLEATSVRWKCHPQAFRQVLHLLCQRKEKLMQFVHEKMRIPSENKIFLKLTCSEELPDEINRNWNRLVLSNMRRMLELESVMWHWSTYGGAYSSMGDYDENWAAQANIVSKRQLRLARAMGNKTLEARCYLYIALSDAQLGKIKEAKDVAKCIYFYATAIKNEFLQNCSKGVFYKIKDISLYLKRRAQKE